MDLTTLARVKVALAITDTDAPRDALLSQLIAGVSRRMERSMLRHAERKDRTEIFTLPANYRTVGLPGVPVDLSGTLTVKVCATRDFTSDEALALVVNDDFTLDETSGLVNLFTLPPTRVSGAQQMPAGPGYVQVAYKGGLAVDTAGLITAYPDIADACDLQVVHRYKRKDSAGASNVKMGSTELAPSGEYKLLEEVASVCAYYRRYSFA